MYERMFFYLSLSEYILLYVTPPEYLWVRLGGNVIKIKKGNRLDKNTLILKTFGKDYKI